MVSLYVVQSCKFFHIVQSVGASCRPDGIGKGCWGHGGAEKYKTRAGSGLYFSLEWPTELTYLHTGA